MLVREAAGEDVRPSPCAVVPAGRPATRRDAHDLSCRRLTMTPMHPLPLRAFLFCLACLVLSLSGCTARQVQERASAPHGLELVILHVNDTHAHVAGIGVNLGCLYGTCPDDENMALLEALAARAGALLGHALHRVSLGGSIFWNWFARRHGHGPHLPPGCIMEFRMGDPLLLGRDMYRDEALLAGDFRQDIFRLSATVLEVTERDIRPPRQSVHNGRGLHADCPDLGKRLRALVDCGSLHTDVRGLSLARPDWRISDFSGNYAILDLSGCPQAPVPGEHVRFIPSYWAVARTCRMPHIRKTLIHDSLPGRALSDSRPASPQQETAPLSEVS